MPTLNERIGEVVKRKRVRDRLTQADLGSRIGVSGSYISSVEAGTTGVRITELEGLATVFRTTAIELINEAAGKDSYNFSASNRERDAFLTLYDSLSGEHKKMARAFLLFLRELELRGEEEGDGSLG
ncbi:MAG TPA: helix-turn-helix transcriptional regulator [Chloroflexaceae bacterium]|nr:helix-turn-helix transcriptional regulator [Chloroflexaceae bacterium]